MKNLLLIIFFSVVLLFPSCNKYSYRIESNVPDCIYDEIDNNKQNSNWMIGSVEEYQFQNKIVYAFLPDEKVIADGATVIKDSDCIELCQVGGFGGPSINLCNGENFYQLAILKRIIWKKR